MFDEILNFWFTEIQPAQWWKVDPAFDVALRERFGTLHQAARQGECWQWRAEPRGRLAEIIILDQFSRNMFRGTAEAFACDPMALALAQEAVAGGHDASLPVAQRTFFYMPYQHSESLRIHCEAERLFAALGPGSHNDFELRHKVIIERFGRYPHRNAALGRESTADELEFLKQPGSRF